MHVRPNICTIAAFNLKIFIERGQSQAGAGQCDQACMFKMSHVSSSACTSCDPHVSGGEGPVSGKMSPLFPAVTWT